MKTEILFSNSRYVFVAEHSEDSYDATDGGIVRVTEFNAETGEYVNAESASVPKSVMNALVSVMSRMDEYSAKCAMYRKRLSDADKGSDEQAAYYKRNYAKGELEPLTKSLKEYIMLGEFIVRFGNCMRGLLDGIESNDDVSAFLKTEMSGVLKTYAEAMR